MPIYDSIKRLLQPNQCRRQFNILGAEIETKQLPTAD